MSVGRECWAQGLALSELARCDKARQVLARCDKVRQVQCDQAQQVQAVAGGR